MRRIRFLAQKEFYHILRDSRSLIIVILMPIMMTVLYGYAINMDINEIILSVVDYDHSADSRDFRNRLYQSRYFIPPETAVDEYDPEEILRAGKAHGVLIIKKGFAEALRTGEAYALGLMIDGSDNNVSAAVQNYTNQLFYQFLTERLTPNRSLPGVVISPQILYNPDLESAHFFVPALVAIILLMISALLTSVTIAREKETGTMEQLLTAPVKPIEILLGKILPYVSLALLDGILVLVFAKVIFGVPFVGSRLLLLGFGLIYISAALSIGILISSLVSTQQVAMMFAVVTTMLPSVMLSGFIFAIKNMPLPIQWLAHIIPAKYFVTIIRGVMLKGAGFQIVAVQGIPLVLLMVVMVVIAAVRFKTKVV